MGRSPALAGVILALLVTAACTSRANALASADPCTLLPAPQYEPVAPSAAFPSGLRVCAFRGTTGESSAVVVGVSNVPASAERPPGASEATPIEVAGHRGHRDRDDPNACTVTVVVAADLLVQVRASGSAPPTDECAAADAAAALVLGS